MTVYATINAKGNIYRLAAKAYGEMVAVWQVGGAQLGDYKLSRFEGGVLTAKTLKGVFDA